ncbi:tRNA (adenosine(37)-N6)-threonylcarbamoyltransferase complex dimerization subunit type 1 TsaB [Solwaraspora sp. WMMD1047]|nr:tRNA (adenosine(37)-N6)-threonylcarbamoyltransferase complex dimerization subunit type 1 TsaB [Solwaraspora sp. WMMD1047]MDG4828500.1 tRNA (adenosine(37)-N6)-threonylcarbamoyltransferase complex dimerization subunit type 1 TsaB [Solwaraspora sp. WMMD1047]
MVDSSTPAVAAALAEVTAEGVALRAERGKVDARAHGELLAPQVDAVLAELGARPRDLAAIVAGTGPGPFTGLRVGLVTAASMGQALGIPAYGVCSLDAIGWTATADLGAAHLGAVDPGAVDPGAVDPGAVDPGAGDMGAVDRGVLDRGGRGLGAVEMGGGGMRSEDSGAGRSGPGAVLVATDARRREIYWAVYLSSGERIVGPEVGVPAAVGDRARELGVGAAVGEGAQRYAEQLGLPLLAGPAHPPPYALAVLAADRIRAAAPAEPLTPLYLRRPDAVAATTRKPVLP